METRADSAPGRSKELPWTIGAKLGSHRVAVFEALADDEGTGLTIPEIVRISQVPRSSAHRIVKDFIGQAIFQVVGRRRKAPILRMNRWDREVVEAARALRAYTAAIARLEAERRGMRLPLGPRQEESIWLGARVTFEESDFARPDATDRLALLSEGR